MTCQWQMGLLVMRECGAPAGAGCSLCGRQLCMTHTLMGQNGPACPQCASANQGYEANEDTELAGSREQYYQPYGGAAAFGRAGYFTPADSAALDHPGLNPQWSKKNKYDAKET